MMLKKSGLFLSGSFQNGREVQIGKSYVGCSRQTHIISKNRLPHWKSIFLHARLVTSLSYGGFMSLFFIPGLHQATEICSSLDWPADVCRWRCVCCNRCGEVETLKWNYHEENGIDTLGSFQFLLGSRKLVNMVQNALRFDLLIYLIIWKCYTFMQMSCVPTFTLIAPPPP